MSTQNKRPSPLTMASEKDFPKESYLRDLKQNYARRKDNIELINSNNILASVIRSLTEQLCRNGGRL
jgi:hypothetical protein